MPQSNLSIGSQITGQRNPGTVVKRRLQGINWPQSIPIPQTERAGTPPTEIPVMRPFRHHVLVSFLERANQEIQELGELHGLPIFTLTLDDQAIQSLAMSNGRMVLDTSWLDPIYNEADDLIGYQLILSDGASQSISESGEIGLVTTYDSFLSYSDLSLVNNLSGGVLWEDPWADAVGPVGITDYDDFESYSDDVTLNGLNGRVSGFPAAWNDALAFIGNINANDDMESYADGVGLAGANGGIGWDSAWVGKLNDPIITSSSATPPSTITLTCPDVGALIYYTLNGTTPTSGSTLYTAPFVLSVETMVKVIAYVGSSFSNVVTQIVFPTLASSGMQVRWEADSLVLTNGNPVASWTDQSGNGRTATQGTVSAQPTYQTNIFGTLPALSFDGGDSMGFTANALSTWTVMAVTKAGNTAYQNCILTWTPSGGDRSGFALNGVGWHCTTLNSGLAETNNRLLSIGVAAGNKYLTTWTYDGSTTPIGRINGVVGTTSANDAGYGSASGLIGFSYQNRIGHIAAIVVWNRVLSASEIASAETYLNNKYAVF